MPTAPPTFHLEVHPEAEAWAPKGLALLRLQRRFPLPHVTIRLWPRRLVGQTTGRVGLPPHAFRARTTGNVADVFVDGTETPRSIAWLIAHELSHHEVRMHPTVREHMQSLRPPSCDEPSSDECHLEDPEELHCDDQATALFGERLDRSWWRTRVRQSS